MKLFSRIFSIVLVAVLLVGSLPATAFAKGDVMYGIGFVNSDTLKLRSTASTRGTVLDTASKDECVVIVSKSGSWYKVIYNLQEGYMHSSYLSVLTRENAELGYGKVNGTAVNLRYGAGTHHRVVTQANKGDKVYIIGLNDGWYKVIFNDKICYIRSDYVDLTEIPYENIDSNQDPLFFRHGKSTGVAPSAQALKNAHQTKPETKPEETVPEETIPEETVPEETVPEETVPEETVPEEIVPEEKPTPVENELLYGIGFVTASGGLRLRSEPNTTSQSLGIAGTNECVVIISKVGDWYKVNYNLQEGYMHGAYLSVLTCENAELGYGKIVKNDTPMHTGPGAAYKVIATGDQGEKAYIIGLNQGWFKVIFGEDICYVSSNMLELTEIPYENRASANHPKFFRMGKSTGIAPSAAALKNDGTPVVGGTANGQQIVATAKKYLGVPYVWGGASPSGFDCSGFVYYVFNSLGYKVSRMIATMNTQGTYVPKSELQPGDIVIFAGTYGSGLSHVGIYVGDGKFIHSPNSRSVVSIASLESGYWADHYYSARRIAN